VLGFDRGKGWHHIVYEVDGEYEWVSLPEEVWNHMSDSEFSVRLKADDAKDDGSSGASKPEKAKADPNKPVDPMDERVTIWDSRTGRKVTGNAAPMQKNLQKYLKKRPYCEVYTELPHQIVRHGPAEDKVSKKRPRSPSPAPAGVVPTPGAVPAFKIEDAGVVPRPGIAVPPQGQGQVFHAVVPLAQTQQVPPPADIESESELSIQDEDEDNGEI